MCLAVLALVVGVGPLAVAAESPPETQGDMATVATLRQERKHAEARKVLERILVADPKHAEASYLLGLYACDAGEWEKALALEATALAADPNSAKYHFGWGAANGIAALKSGVLSKFGYAKKCLAGYRRAVELEPGNVQYRFALLNYYRQAPAMVGGGMDKAFAQAAEIKKLNAPLGRHAFTELYLAEKKFDLAFQEHESVLRETPKDYLALFGFGRVAILSGQRMEEGLQALNQCLALTPPDGASPRHAEVHWRVGGLLERLSRREEARAAYERALSLDPAFAPAKRALEKLNSAKG